MDLSERLQKARIAAGYNSVREAAAAVGVNYQTYAGHENGSSGFRADKGALYARRFKVNFEWLMSGRGPMLPNNAAPKVPLVGYIGAGAEISPDIEQIPDGGLGFVEIPLTLPDEMIALLIRGDSMMPAYQDGGILIVHRHQTKPLEQYFGQEAAVRTADGRRYLKTVERGQNGTVNLMSWNAKPIYNVSLEWIGEIFGYFKPGQLAIEEWT